MKQPLQITFHGMSPSEALEAAARVKCDHLERFCGELMACRVVVELEEQHRRQGKPFGVRIELTLPGRELVVNRVRNEDAYVALRDAFDDMKRRIEDTVRRRRDAQRQPTPEVRDEVTGDGEPS